MKASGGLVYLEGLPALEELTIHASSEESDGRLLQLPRLTLIKTLSLYGGSLNCLETPNLEELYLGGALELGDAGAPCLARLSKLKKLWFGFDVDLSDATLESVGKLESLQNLELRGCGKVTDMGLLRLANLTNLTELKIEVSNPDQFSAASLAELRRKLPKCRIDYGRLVLVN